MALNYPGPQEVRIFYTTDGLAHTMKLNCQVFDFESEALGQPFSAYQVLDRIGGTTALDTAVTNWVTLIKARFSAATASFNRAELWTYAPNSFDASYVSAMTLAIAGTSGSATTKAQSEIYTLRTQEGGVMRIALMETASVAGTSIRPPIPAGSVKDIFDYLESTTNWIIGRDTSYPFATIGFHPGGNEKLFKLRFRAL